MPQEPMHSRHDVLDPKTLGQVQASLPTVWTQQAAIANFSVQTANWAICKQLIISIWFYCLSALVCCSTLAGLPARRCGYFTPLRYC
jgi:hypothetical protein